MVANKSRDLLPNVKGAPQLPKHVPTDFHANQSMLG